MATVYKDVLVDVPVTILNGASVSNLINCAALPNFQGAATLMRVSLPAGFPAGNMSFITQNFVNGAIDTTQYPFSLTDGVDTAAPLVPVAGGLQSIAFPAYWFASVVLIRLKMNAPVSGDQIFTAHFQPIIQGANNV